MIKTIEKLAADGLESWLGSGATTYPQTQEEALEWINQKINRNIRLPVRYEDAELETGENQSAILDFLSQYDDSKGLFLYGPCGTGKTHLLYALSRIFIANNRDVIVLTITELLDGSRKEFDAERTYLEKIMKHTGVLMLDDMGAEKTSDWTSEVVYKVINHRYLHVLPTFITSNLDMQGIHDKYGDRVSSRLSEMCEEIELKGDDKRLQSND